MRYDLVVIGGSAAGRNGALTAARLKKRVALVERDGDHNLGQLERCGVDCHRGIASFTGPHELLVQTDRESTTLQAEYILLACGTRPVLPSYLPVDGRRIFGPDDIAQLEELPQSLIVVGGGVVGLEHALWMASRGMRVTIVDGNERLLEFCDRDIVETLLFHCRSLGIDFRLGEDVIGVDHLSGNRVAVQLAGGRRLIGDGVLSAVGRAGNTDSLNLSAAGLAADDQGRLWCDEDDRTWASHIYGAGDIVGFPVWAGLSVAPGRRAVCHAFGQHCEWARNIPCGLNTIPEILMVGKSEEQLRKQGVPYENGIARFGEPGCGENTDERPGLLKILFHRASRRLVGVHYIGEDAAEMIDFGQSLLNANLRIDEIPTTDCDNSRLDRHFQAAAGDGLSKLVVPRDEERSHQVLSLSQA
jgi:NAD(P) transhydrogenase